MHSIMQNLPLIFPTIRSANNSNSLVWIPVSDNMATETSRFVEGYNWRLRVQSYLILLSPKHFSSHARSSSYCHIPCVPLQQLKHIQIPLTFLPLSHPTPTPQVPHLLFKCALLLSQDQSQTSRAHNTKFSYSIVYLIPRTIHVHLPDHIPQLFVGGVLTQSLHDSPQLAHSDCPVTVLVKQLKRVPHFCATQGIFAIVIYE